VRIYRSNTLHPAISAEHRLYAISVAPCQSVLAAIDVDRKKPQQVSRRFLSRANGISARGSGKMRPIREADRPQETRQGALGASAGRHGLVADWHWADLNGIAPKRNGKIVIATARPQAENPLA